MTVKITRTELDAAGLRALAARGKDAAVARRLLGLALVLEGHPRAKAAQMAGMDRQTLPDWIHRYNEHGVAGLSNRANPGRPPRSLSPEQEATVAEWVRHGPDRAKHKVIRWRLVDLRDEAARVFDVHLHERTMGKLLRRLGFSHISTRPRHPSADPAAQDAHKKTSRPWLPAPCPQPPEASRSRSGGRMKPGSDKRAA